MLCLTFTTEPPFGFNKCVDILLYTQIQKLMHCFILKVCTLILKLCVSILEFNCCSIQSYVLDFRH